MSRIPVASIVEAVAPDPALLLDVPADDRDRLGRPGSVRPEPPRLSALASDREGRGTILAASLRLAQLGGCARS
jgi:hypothetical protein